MADEETVDFDAELNAIMEGPEAQEATQAAAQTPAQVVEKQALKYGGRDWDSHESLGKAYESLLKDYSRKSSDLKSNEKFINWGKAVSKHQDLASEIDAKISEFNQRVKAGQSPAQAKAAVDANPEFMKRFEQMESFITQKQVDSEIDSLKTRYSLDRDALNEVIEHAIQLGEKGVNLPLESVYKMVAFDKQKVAAKAEGEKLGAASAMKKRASNVGPSTAAGVAPASKGVDSMSRTEYDNAIEQELAKYGISG